MFASKKNLQLMLCILFFSLREFGPILLPLQSAMRVTLPSTPGSHVDHNPFPTDPIFLQGFEDGVSTEPCPSLNQQVLINRCVSPNTHLNCGSLQNHLCHSTNRCLPTGVLFHQIHTWIVSLQNLLCCPTNRCLLFTDVSCLLIYPWLMFYFKMFSVAQSTGACQQVCCFTWYTPELCLFRLRSCPPCSALRRSRWTAATGSCTPCCVNQR